MNYFSTLDQSKSMKNRAKHSQLSTIIQLVHMKKIVSAKNCHFFKFELVRGVLHGVNLENRWQGTLKIDSI